jgi:hypothetical protein
LRIQLSKGYSTVVDDTDPKKPWLQKWHAVERRTADTNQLYAVYAATNYCTPEGKRRQLLMHRYLLGLTNPKVEVDHKDGNGLNNHRRNLRKATDGQNAMNAAKRKDNTSGHKGVNWHLWQGKWTARVQVGRKRISLGYFDTLEEAVKARIAGAKKHHKSFAMEAR